jgi:hypothetical protein
MSDLDFVLTASVRNTLQRSMIGDKLKRAALQSDIANPLTLPPMVPPPNWQPDTPYVAGQAVANGGQCFVYVIGTNAGGTTTSASSGGPVSSGNGALIADGALFCAWVGAVSQYTDPDAPVLTKTTGSPAGLTQFVYPGDSPASFRAYGANPVPINTSNWSMNVFSSNASTIATGSGSAVGFETDALKFAIAIGSGNANVVRVLIDGRYYSPSSTDRNTATTWYVFDFSTKGPRRFRNIRVESPLNSFIFLGVAIATGDQIRPPSRGLDIRAVFMGSSLFDGSAYSPWQPGNTVPNRVAKTLGWSDPWNFSTGGTGPITKGAGSAFYTYGERVPEALTLNPDVWIFDGAINEVLSNNTPAATKTAIKSYLAAVRNGGSTAPIYQLGVWPIAATSNGGDAAVVAMENATQEAVSEFNDPLGLTFFIPCRTDTIPWVRGSYNGATTQQTNTGLVMAADAVHPTELGVVHMSDLISFGIGSSYYSF